MSRETKDATGREIKEGDVVSYAVSAYGSGVCMKFGVIDKVLEKDSYRYDYRDNKNPKKIPCKYYSFKIQPISWELSRESWHPSYKMIDGKWQKDTNAIKPDRPRTRIITDNERIVVLDKNVDELIENSST